MVLTNCRRRANDTLPTKKEVITQILALLDDGDAHGYLIHQYLMLKEVAVTLDYVYRVLQEMEGKELVSSFWELSSREKGREDPNRTDKSDGGKGRKKHIYRIWNRAWIC